MILYWSWEYTTAGTFIVDYNQLAQLQVFEAMLMHK